MINPELFTTLSYRDDINLRGIVIENEREAFHLACQNFTDRTSIRYKEYRKALSKKRRSMGKKVDKRHGEFLNKRHCVTNKVLRAIKKGFIVRPNICSKCNNEDFILAHHEDYDKPFNIIWLCNSCHRKQHFEKNKNEIWEFI